MKTQLLLPIILLFAFATANTFAQIPNNGFEDWGTSTITCEGNPETYPTPTGWVGGRATACGGGYSIQQVTDNYPVGTGLNSILVQSDIANGILGIALTGNIAGPAKPTFPITGHPTSLTGYYKFAPLNNDTMQIAMLLYQNGSIVSGGSFTSTVSMSNWTYFSFPFSTYTTADSGFIVLSAYHAAGSPAQYYPHGNSALSIDNLNFDNLITGITDIGDENKTSVYPNPFSAQTTLKTDKVLKGATLTLYNSLGQQVRQVNNISGQTVALNRNNLPSGLYYLQLTQNNQTIATDKLVITDH